MYAGEIHYTKNTNTVAGVHFLTVGEAGIFTWISSSQHAVQTGACIGRREHTR